MQVATTTRIERSPVPAKSDAPPSPSSPEAIDVAARSTAEQRRFFVHLNDIWDDGYEAGTQSQSTSSTFSSTAKFDGKGRTLSRDHGSRNIKDADANKAGLTNSLDILYGYKSRKHVLAVMLLYHVNDPSECIDLCFSRSIRLPPPLAGDDPAGC
ncbi:BZ3500_MvSof-1268-A1-R1_Chr5-2g08101 [Microbotryum saponariae]|uniref:BZ3500_MvSof-1268-A1-R1_Chr5-2g08101 protein n=1 Tax=Microbotryum saponariae TaxID=289078 RepID=A0A2X0LL42_9BASI|nr:BZ3500_MvSof-1268-A1-R1_Chr5-2g08101 [Microbotryum saponariae]SDA05970.1 BZ3501_MvSof-1269-A2-R1_Chr5-2g07923 [Microbotryum saponariae]